MNFVAALHWSLAFARWELQSSVPVVVGTFVAMAICIGLALARNRIAAILLFPLAAMWVLCNQYVEGPVLFSFNHDRGITLADLLSVLAVLVGGAELLASRLRQHKTTDARI